MCHQHSLKSIPAVQKGCYDYVDDTYDDIELSDVDGCSSSYLYETQDKDMIELLFSVGACRDLAGNVHLKVLRGSLKLPAYIVLNDTLLFSVEAVSFILLFCGLSPNAITFTLMNIQIYFAMKGINTMRIKEIGAVLTCICGVVCPMETSLVKELSKDSSLFSCEGRLLDLVSYTFGKQRENERGKIKEWKLRESKGI